MGRQTNAASKSQFDGRSIPSWMHKTARSTSPELAEQPSTPMRVSSSSNSKAAGAGCLQPQYSDDSMDEVNAEIVPLVGKQHQQQHHQQQHHHQQPQQLGGGSSKHKAQQTQEAQQQAQWTAAKQAAAVVTACVCWIMISSATILINKHIMVDLSFHYPAAVSALGMVGTTVASFLVCCVFKLVPCKVTITPYFFFTRIMFTGFLIALSFQAGNTAYLYLSVAFVQMLKAFTPVSTMLYGFLFGLEKPSAKLIAAVGCISFGVVVSSFGELNFSTFGVAAMLTSIAAEGLRTVLMQHLLASKQFHPLEAWIYLGPACIIWLVVLIGVVEAHEMHTQHALTIMAEHKWYFAFAALAGFACNSLAMLVIKLASALTLKVLGLCKDVGLLVFGVLLLGEHVAGLQVGGYSLSLMGFAAYNYIKASGPAATELPRLTSASPSKTRRAISRQTSTVYFSCSSGSTSSSSNTSSSSSQALTSYQHSHQQQQQGGFAVSVYEPATLSLSEPLLPHTVPVCIKSH